MPAAWTLVTWLLVVPSGPFWPDALATDARFVAEAPAPERLRALELLSSRAGDAATPLLRALLADPDPGVRLYATRWMIRAGDPAGPEAAAARIVAPGAPSLDRQLGLELLRDSPVLPPAGRALAERALHDADPGVRAAAVDVFRRHGAGAALPAILASFDDDNREVRLRAVRVVAASRDPRVALSLLGSIDDGDRQVRLEAVRALAGHPRALPALLRLVQGGNPGDVGGGDDLRTTAIDSLGALRADGAVPALAELARRRPQDELARHAQLALGQVATPAAVAALVALAGTPWVADEVRQGLRRAGAPAVPALLRTLEQGTPTGAGVAVSVLGELGDRRATLPLAAVVGRRAELAPLAITALRALADPAAVPVLVRAAESPVLELRRRAVDALLALRDPRAQAVVQQGLVDPDGQVRTLSARLAVVLDDGAAVPALALRLSDADPSVRLAAAEALSALAVPSSATVAAMLAALAHPQAPARDDNEWSAVGTALARLITTGDAPRLATAAATATGPQRIAIARALAAAHERTPLEDRTVIARLVAALGDGGAVALAAADALATARIPDGDVGALARAFVAGPPELRARLCPALAGTSRGGPWLAALVTARDEAVSVRAAAAWAARALPATRDALRAVSAGPDDADGGLGDPGGGPDDPGGTIAANARAALAVRDRRTATTWTEVRLRAPDGTPWAARWVAVTPARGGAVWALTDSTGVARLGGLPEGPLTLRTAEPAKLAPGSGF